METQVAQWLPPQENPNFVSRPPDPGALNYYATAAWDSIYHSPFSGVYRSSQLTIEKTGMLNGVTWSLEDGTTTDQNLADRQYDLITADEATRKYGLDGQLKFDEPIRESAARLMYQRKINENDRSYVLQSGATTGFRQAAGLGVGMAATLVDPINVAMMFVPVVGEARMAQMVAKYGLTRARLAAGAVEGFVGSAMAEPFVLLPALQEQANYGLQDSALNLGFGVVLGAGLQAGLGAVGDKIRSLKPKEANAIFESAMNDVLQDRPVSTPAKVYEFTDSFTDLQTYATEVTLEVNVTGDPNVTGFPKSPDDYRIVPGESIAGAAIQYGEKIAMGNSHPQIISALNDVGIQLGSDWSDGFVTSTGRYVSREEAARIQELRTGRSVGNSDKVIGSEDFGSGEDLLPQSQLSLNDIPLRDSRGKFLSKARRLELLQEKITAERARGESLRDDSRQVNTQTDEPRVNPNIPPKSMDDSEVTRIDAETADLEAEIGGLDDADSESIKSRVEELTKDIGDVAAREKAVNTATECIIRNLL